jgi:hypothetical protein
MTEVRGDGDVPVQVSKRFSCKQTDESVSSVVRLICPIAAGYACFRSSKGLGK